MISIELCGKDGQPYETLSHASFIDHAQRDTGSSELSIFEIHDENLVAPVIARLDGKNALATFPDIAKALKDVTGMATKKRTLEDGLRILELLKPLTREHPEGRWFIGGHETVSLDGRYLSIQKQPRFSPRSLSIDIMRGDVTFIGDADRMDDVDGLELDPLEKSEISIEEAMRRARSNPDDKSSGSSGSKGRKKSSEGGKTFLDCPLPSKPKTAVVGVRVSNEIKAAIDAEPEAKKALFEAVGAALMSGAKYVDVLARIQELLPEGLTTAAEQCYPLPQPPLSPEDC